MLTEKEMLEIAELYMKCRNPKGKFDPVIVEVEKKEYGNIYYYQNNKYLTTKRIEDAITNANPFLVENTRRRVVQFGWNDDDEIKQFENGTLVPTLHTYWYPDEDRFSHK